MERAFVQAIRMDRPRAHKRSEQCLAHGRTESAIGTLLALVQDYAVAKESETQAETIDSIIKISPHLNLKQRRSACRICTLIVLALFSEGFQEKAPAVVQVTRLMLELTDKIDQSSLDLLDILRCLETTARLKIKPDGLEALRRLYQAIAAGVPVSTSERTAEQEAPLTGTGSRTKAMSEPETNAIEAQPTLSRTNLPAVRVPHAKIVAARGQEKLQLLYQQLAVASDDFGSHSTEVTVALTELLEYYAAINEPIPEPKLLEELTKLCTDAEIALSTYQLRNVYALSTQFQKQEQTFLSLEELQRSLFMRREKAVGWDYSTAVALSGLIDLWQQTGKLVTGKNFCREILDRASKTSGLDDLTMRLLNSAQNKIDYLLKRQGGVDEVAERSGDTVEDNQAAASRGLSPQGSGQPQAKEQSNAVTSSARGSSLIVRETSQSNIYKYNDAREFVSSAALAAIDSLYRRDLEKTSNYLNELLIFYTDCVGDSAREVGETLWLLIETDLRSVDGFAEKLLEISSRKATDDHLVSRFEGHLLRLSDLTATDEEKIKLLKHGIHSLNPASSESMHLQAILTQLTSGSSETRASKSKREQSKERFTAEFWGYIGRKTSAKEIASSIERVSAGKAKLLGAWVWLCEQLALHGQSEIAAQLLQEIITVVPGELADTTNRLKIKLSTLYLANGNCLDAASLLFQAFSSIPEP